MEPDDKQLEALRQSHEELWTRVEGIAGILGDLEQRLDQPLPAAGEANPDEPPAEPVFRSLRSFVDEYFVSLFTREIGGEWRWCAQWWEHSEAVYILYNLWERWEVLRSQPGGAANWYRDYLLPFRDQLMSPHGPFARCEAAYGQLNHKPNTKLPTEPPPIDNEVRNGE